MHIQQLYTHRLRIDPLLSPLPRGEKESLLKSIPQLLSPAVVESLPDYFHHIHSIVDAEKWLDKMLHESQLYGVTHLEHEKLIGFVFLFMSDTSDAHIGYLLGESYWGEGYAYELLDEFIRACKDSNVCKRIVGGVNIDNVPSFRLLEKLGFREISQHNDVSLLAYGL